MVVSKGGAGDRATLVRACCCVLDNTCSGALTEPFTLGADPCPGLLPSCCSASRGGTRAQSAPQLRELGQVEMSLHLREMSVSLSGQCFRFFLPPDSPRSHSSWCAVQETTFRGYLFFQAARSPGFVGCFPLAVSGRAPSLVCAVCQLFPVGNSW